MEVMEYRERNDRMTRIRILTVDEILDFLKINDQNKSKIKKECGKKVECIILLHLKSILLHKLHV